MSHPTRMMLALFATLALAGMAEAWLSPPGDGQSHLARTAAPTPSSSWVAALR